MKDISRRKFLKGTLAGAAGLAVGSTVLAACSSKGKSLYKPGTYSATAKGIGTVKVTMTFRKDAITDVVLDCSAETASIGQKVAPQLKEALMKAQSAKIDAISGATVTTNAVIKAAEKCIAQAKGEIAVEVKTSAGSAAGTASWLGTAPEIADKDISETWETDILIIGAGNGGMCAGAYAAKHGLKFRIIEKGTAMARRRGWYGAIDSEDARAAGEKPVDRAALFNELKRYASGKCDLRLFAVWANESAAMHKFIKDCYAEYEPSAKVQITAGKEAVWPEAQGFYFPVCEHFWGSAKTDRHEMFRQIIQKDGGTDIDFNTSLVKLEKDANGRVVSAIAQNTQTEKYIRIKASKGILLATGGYPFNPDMMQALDPMGSAVTTSNVAWPTDTGDGIKAAMWVGGALQGEAAPMLFDRGIVPPGTDAGYQTLPNGDKVFPGTEGQFNLSTQPFLKVNRFGQRFTNESGTYDMMSYAAFNQPGHVYAIIFDDNMPNDVQRFHTLGCSAQTRANPKGQLDMFADKEAKGMAFTANTLDELADKLGFKGEAKDTFLATCKRYNELYDKQRDDDFGKPAYRLSALKKAPFRGYWLGACLLTTEQGILSNEKAQVVNDKHEPIEGLYVCGDNAGGFFYNNYPCLMPGIAMGRNMTFAIKAIKQMGGLEK